MVPADGHRALRVMCWMFGVIISLGGVALLALNVDGYRPALGSALAVVTLGFGAAFIVAGCFARHISDWMDQ